MNGIGELGLDVEVEESVVEGSTEEELEGPGAAKWSIGRWVGSWVGEGGGKVGKVRKKERREGRER